MTGLVLTSVQMVGGSLTELALAGRGARRGIRMRANRRMMAGPEFLRRENHTPDESILKTTIRCSADMYEKRDFE
jgi:hypothetical protein